MKGKDWTGTPFPWTCNLKREWAVYGKGHRIVCMPCSVRTEKEKRDGAHYDWDRDTANARLICAAPDLLEACKEAFEHFEIMHGKSATFRRLSRAIKKATGE